MQREVGVHRGLEVRAAMIELWASMELIFSRARSWGPVCVWAGSVGI